MINIQRLKPRRTYSVCPLCLKRIPAVMAEENGEVRMLKTCTEHGDFSAVVWRGAPSRAEWTGDAPEIAPGENQSCPNACGLCPDHRQDTCCVLLEITSRCNLSCEYCFAIAENGAENGAAEGTASKVATSLSSKNGDPSLAQVKEWIADIAGRGRTFLQLSGGEPTLRDDLPEIVRFAKAAGCEYVQLNSNGLRLAQDDGFTAALAAAGLSFVFMQFDGVSDDVYQRLRGRPLLALKKQALENCGRHNIGVTLVPTLVPGVNSQFVGNILRFAVEHSPLVRGVHFQPVSYFGRYPQAPGDEQRMTLPEVFQAIFTQAGDIVPAGSIVPSHCDHAACGFHGGYIATPGGLKSMAPKERPACCASSASPADKNRRFVGSRWLRPLTSAPLCCGADATADAAHGTFRQVSSGVSGNISPATPPGDSWDLSSLDNFLIRSRSHAFTISAMAFQDAYTLDLERLRQCSLHVYSKGRIMPFCSHYLTRTGADSPA